MSNVLRLMLRDRSLVGAAFAFAAGATMPCEAIICANIWLAIICA